MSLRRLRQWFVETLKWSLPILVIFVAICIEHMPLKSLLQQSLVPMTGIMTVLAFSIRRPGIMPPYLVFVLMLIAELYAGAIPGTFTIPALVVRFVVLEQKEFFTFAPFYAIWPMTSLLILVFAAIHWAAMIGFHLRFIDPTPLFVRALVSSAVFPLVSVIAFGVCRFLWPVKSVDERLTYDGVQYLPLGMKMPKAAKGSKQSAQPGLLDSLFKGSVFRRIQRPEKPKPWMEL